MMGDAPGRFVKRKRARYVGAPGSAWKVAYADFVTAMMALFIVLWILTQADMKLRQQIARYFRDPEASPAGAAIASGMIAAKTRQPKIVIQDVVIVRDDGEENLFEAQKKEIEDAIKEAAREDPLLAPLRDHVIVQVTDLGLSIEILDKSRGLLFDATSASLQPAAVDLLKRLAAQLGRMPNSIQVGGHTENRPRAASARVTSWELAFSRAEAARAVLETSGLWSGQVHRVVAYADSEPLVPGNPSADENRRLSILAERTRPRPARPGRGRPPAGA
jgi:chemotaxis protein MotB